jgi:hypothetical protein
LNAAPRPQSGSNILDVVAGDDFNLAPVRLEIRIVSQFEVRAQSMNEFRKIKEPARDPVFGRKLKKSAPEPCPLLYRCLLGSIW